MRHASSFRRRSSIRSKQVATDGGQMPARERQGDGRSAQTGTIESEQITIPVVDRQVSMTQAVILAVALIIGVMVATGGTESVTSKLPGR